MIIWAPFAISLIIFAFYVFLPWSLSCFEFECAYKIWRDWQTIFAAMIALFASGVALESTQHSEKKAAERNLAAKKPMLTLSFAKLMDFLDDHIGLYHQSIVQLGNNQQSFYYQNLPASLPMGATEIMSEVVKYAPPEIGRYFCRIIGLVQIFYSRKEDDFKFPKMGAHNVQVLVDDDALKNRIGLVLYIRVLISNQFEWARGIKNDFSNSMPTKDDCISQWRWVLLDLDIIRFGVVGSPPAYMEQFLHENFERIKDKDGYYSSLQNGDPARFFERIACWLQSKIAFLKKDSAGKR